MGVRADVVGQHAVGRKPLAQNVQSLKRRKVRAGWTERFVPKHRDAREKSLVDQSLVAAGVALIASNRRVQVAGLVPNQIQTVAALSRFGAEVNDRRPGFHPLFVIDLDGIVANGDDEIGPVGELFDIAASRPADDAGRVCMALRQKTFAVQGRDEWNILPLDEWNKFDSPRSA